VTASTVRHVFTWPRSNTESRPTSGQRSALRKTAIFRCWSNPVRLSKFVPLITTAKLRTKKKTIATSSFDELQNTAGGLICLTGDEHGPLAHALQKGGIDEGQRVLRQLISIFGSQNVYVELQRHANRFQESRNQAAVSLAQERGLPLLATNGVRYATPAEREIADVFTCLKNKCRLETAGRFYLYVYLFLLNLSGYGKNKKAQSILKRTLG
jgi:DNA polymerase III alpha subunit